MEDNGSLQLAAVVLQDYGPVAYDDTQAMFDYVFGNFEKVPVAQLDQEESLTEELKGINGTMEDGTYVVLPKNADGMKVQSNLEMQDATNGKVIYTYDGQVVGTADVKAKATAVKAKTEKNKKEKEKKTSPIIWVGVVVGILVILGVILFVVQYIRYKKRMERRRRMRRKRAAQARKAQARKNTRN